MKSLNHNIKQLKPKIKNNKSKYFQGYINTKGCKKLFESQQSKPIIYRSSWEKAFIEYLENCDDIINWGSECVCISYTNYDGVKHHYYPDFVAKDINDNIYIIEIKPYCQTIKPKCADKHSNAWKTYMKNQCKWFAAKQFCEKNGYIFKIITEKTIFKLL